MIFRILDHQIEQSIDLKASLEASEEKIDQQAEHFNDSSRIHLRSEH
jgi:hypothetical protein